MTPVLHLLLASISLAGPRAAHTAPRAITPTPCPAANPEGAVRVQRLLQSPHIPELRRRFDLGTASADDVTPLTAAPDHAACDALWSAVAATDEPLRPGDSIGFYRSGDTYFVPIRRYRAPQPGVTYLDGRSALHVYDANFELIGKFMA